MLDVLPQFDTNSTQPLYMQIYKYIKDEVLSGRMQPGSKLPSIRNLAKDLNLSKNTIEAAYDQLIAEGYIKSIDRSGVYVEKIERELRPRKLAPTPSDEEPIDINHTYSFKYNFSSGLIDTSAFPYVQFKKVLNQCLNENSRELLLYGDHRGDYGLRLEIAKYLHYSRGVMCKPDQIIISSGTQQSLTTLCHVLSRFKYTLGFEEPGYKGARSVFSHFNYNIIPIPLEPDGIDIEALKKTDAKLAYVTPSHQFPCGMVMSVAKRISLIKWAKENSGYIIEDDYDGEFKSKGKPIPSLQGLDGSQRVIYVGNFSKSLMPSMRISYIVLPPSLLEIYEESYKVYEQPVSRIIQKSLEIFMKEGYWDKHLKRARILYRKKQELLIDSINRSFGNRAEIIGADSGLHILLKVHTDLTEQHIIQEGFKRSLKVNQTSIHWINPPENSFPVLFLGFAGINQANIPVGINILNDICFEKK